jgi:hypothetical protein
MIGASNAAELRLQDWHLPLLAATNKSLAERDKSILLTPA